MDGPVIRTHTKQGPSSECLQHKHEKRCTSRWTIVNGVLAMGWCIGWGEFIGLYAMTKTCDTIYSNVFYMTLLIILP